MFGSPFKGAEDYVAATGTLHSFTNYPGSATVTLILAAVLTLYFLVRAYTIR
jgi:hypothetical protein